MWDGEIFLKNILLYIFRITTSPSWQRSVGGIYVGDLMAQSQTTLILSSDTERSLTFFRCCKEGCKHSLTVIVIFSSLSDLFYLTFYWQFCSWKLSVMQLCESTGCFKLCFCLKLEPNQWKPMTSNHINELKEALGQLPLWTILLYRCTTV